MKTVVRFGIQLVLLNIKGNLLMKGKKFFSNVSFLDDMNRRKQITD